MPWQNPSVVKNTSEEEIFGVSIEFVDLAEFSSSPFFFRDDRVTNDAAGRTAFKVAAEAALKVERSRRTNVSGKETTFLNFMNS